MNRAEFLEALNLRLQNISADEREEALKYYNEYLDEAGPENEEAVIAELGGPEKVANIIRANRLGEPEAAEPAQASQNSCASTPPHGPYYTQAQYTPPERGAYKYNGNVGRNGMPTWMIIVLVVTFPLWFGLLGTLFGLLFGLIGTLAGFVGAGFMLIVVGVIGVVSAVGMLASLPGSGILMIGVSLLCIALGLLISALMVWAIRAWVPALWSGACSICRNLFGRAGA